MSITDRAITAFSAERQARDLESQAGALRTQSEAVTAIIARGEQFGIDIDPDDINLVSEYSQTYTYELQLEADATLVIQYKGLYYGDEDHMNVKVRPADQLYWDLPPGVESKSAGGGAYGCFGLGHLPSHCPSLAYVGESLVKIRAARVAWRRKHGVEE